MEKYAPAERKHIRVNFLQFQLDDLEAMRWELYYLAHANTAHIKALIVLFASLPLLFIPGLRQILCVTLLDIFERTTWQRFSLIPLAFAEEIQVIYVTWLDIFGMTTWQKLGLEAFSFPNTKVLLRVLDEAIRRKKLGPTGHYNEDEQLNHLP